MRKVHFGAIFSKFSKKNSKNFSEIFSYQTNNPKNILIYILIVILYHNILQMINLRYHVHEVADNH